MKKLLLVLGLTLLACGCTEPFVGFPSGELGGGGAASVVSATTTATSSASSTTGVGGFGGGGECVPSAYYCDDDLLWRCEPDETWSSQDCAETQSVCFEGGCESDLIFAVSFLLPWHDEITDQQPSTAAPVEPWDDAVVCSGGHVEFAALPVSPLDFPLTLLVTVRPDADATASGIIMATDAGANGYAGAWLSYDPLDGSVAAGFGDGTGTGPNDRRGVRSTAPIFAGQWSTVAAVIASADDIRLYVDGAELPVVESGSATMIANTNSPLWIGAGTWGGAPASSFYGDIDDARIYARALTAQELSLHE